MASSTQFSIRALMIVTVVVAVLCAAIAPMLRQLGPSQLPRAIAYLALLGGVSGAVAAGSCFRRRRIEKKAGRLLARTGFGGDLLRWTSLFAAILLATMAAGVAILLAQVDSIDTGLRSIALLLRCIIALVSLCAAFTAIGLFLYWWWGTGFLANEAFENGIVVRGLYFLPWSKLVSYERSIGFLVNVEARRGARPTRILVAARDRDEWERILSEKGVPPAKSLRGGRMVNLGNTLK